MNVPEGAAGGTAEGATEAVVGGSGAPTVTAGAEPGALLRADRPSVDPDLVTLGCLFADADDVLAVRPAGPALPAAVVPATAATDPDPSRAATRVGIIVLPAGRLAW